MQVRLQALGGMYHSLYRNHYLQRIIAGDAPDPSNGQGDTNTLTPEDAPDPSNSHSNTDALTPEDMPHPPSGSHSTPSISPSCPDPMIDPRLIETLGLDRSMLTLASPPVPQMPSAPGPSMRSSLSPLSDVPNMMMTEESPCLKRKRQASKGKAAPRPRRKARA